MRRALTFGCGTAVLAAILAGILTMLGVGPIPRTTPATESAQQAVTTALGIAIGPDVGTSAYLFGITSITEDMERSLERFTELIADPRVGDAAWRLDVATQLMIWHESYVDAHTLIPPPELAEAHAHVLDTLRRYDEISRAIESGVAAQDLDVIADAARAVTKQPNSIEQMFVAMRGATP